MTSSLNPPTWTICVALADVGAAIFFGWMGLKSIALDACDPDLAVFLFVVGTVNFLFATLWLFTTLDDSKAANYQSACNGCLLLIGIIIVLRHFLERPQRSKQFCDSVTEVVMRIVLMICFLYWLTVASLILWKRENNKDISRNGQRHTLHRDKSMVRWALVLLSLGNLLFLKKKFFKSPTLKDFF